VGAACGRDAAPRRTPPLRSPLDPSKLKPLPPRRCAIFTITSTAWAWSRPGARGDASRHRRLDHHSRGRCPFHPTRLGVWPRARRVRCADQGPRGRRGLRDHDQGWHPPAELGWDVACRVVVLPQSTQVHPGVRRWRIYIPARDRHNSWVLEDDPLDWSSRVRSIGLRAKQVPLE